MHSRWLALMRLPVIQLSVSPTVFVLIVALIFGVSAIGTYAALLYGPSTHNLLSLRIAFFWFNLLLYLVAPVCWLMPVFWREAHLFMWLSSNLIARILASEIPISTRDKPIDAILFMLGLLIDGLFLTGGILAIRAKEKPPNWKASGYFLLSAVLPAAGLFVSLMLWSQQVANVFSVEAGKLIQGRPYCIASHRRKLEDLSRISGIRLLRSRYDVGPGAGFSFLTYSHFYAVLAVQIGNEVQYWNWSFKQGGFVRDKNTPQIRLRVDACDPITGEKFYYSEF
ncbi:MAG: hypothetical protein ACLPPF_10500 [Rhodomicrobium sp.]